MTKSAKVLDLLNSRLFLRLSSSPHDLEALIEPERDKIIVIDEIQRIPELLNEVHRLIVPEQTFRSGTIYPVDHNIQSRPKLESVAGVGIPVLTSQPIAS